MKLRALDPNPKRVPVADERRNSPSSASKLWWLPVVRQRNDGLPDVIHCETDVMQTLPVLIEPTCDLAWAAWRHKLDIDISTIEIGERDRWMIELIHVRNL